MLVDNLRLLNRGQILRTASAYGSSFPSEPNDLDLFEIVDGGSLVDGVYVYSERLADWVAVENVNRDIYDIGLTIFDRPRSLDVVCKHIAARTFVIKPGFEGSIARASFAASDVTVFQVQVLTGTSALSVGTLTFAVDSDVGVFSTVDNTAIVVARGQVLRIVSPEIRDATLSSIDVTISGELLVPR